MNTKHVPDVELCQEFDRLCKEKNITLPETEFYWSLIDEKTNHWGVEEDRGIGDQIPAPLVSEQGEWLKKTDWGVPYTASNWTNWQVRAPHPSGKTYLKGNTEANARMKCLLYLLENDIIDGNAFN